MVEDRLCNERHNSLNEKLKVHERRINDHSKRIDSIEQNNSRMDERLSGLIAQLGTLNSTLRWFMGLLVGSFVTFFFYAAQKGLL